MFVAVCSVLCQAFSWVEQFLVAMPVRAALSKFSKDKNQIRGIDWRIRKNLKIALRVTGSEEVFFKSMAEGRNYIASLPEPSGLNCFECIMVVIVTLTFIRRWPVVPTAIGGEDRACARCRARHGFISTHNVITTNKITLKFTCRSKSAIGGGGRACATCRARHGFIFHP